MANSPEVAVIMPVFDPGPSLRDAINSVVAQTIGSWEVVVVDDGSTQDVEWVTSIDARVSLARLQHGGVSAARNRGAGLTSAPLLAFLDDDDTWAPDKLERQLSMMAARGSLFCHTAFEWRQITGAGAVTTHIRHYPTEITYSALLRGDHVCTSSVVLDRQLFTDVGGFRADLTHAEDLDLWLRLLRSGVDSTAVDEPLVRYTTHASGASNDYERTYRARSEILHEHLRYARGRGDSDSADAARRGLARGRELAAYQAFDAARASQRGSQRLRHLARSVRRDPRVVRDAIAHRLSRNSEEQ